MAFPEACRTFQDQDITDKEIRAGEPVGYGCADVSDTDRTIAIFLSDMLMG